MSDIDNKIAVEWLQCRKIIAEFLREVTPEESQETIDHNAAAIIARLSNGGFSLESIADCEDRDALRAVFDETQGGIECKLAHLNNINIAASLLRRCAGEAGLAVALDLEQFEAKARAALAGEGEKR